MGAMWGHVFPGIGFFIIGSWHLFNNIKLHALNPNSHTSRTWFPTSKMRYLELFLIMGGSATSIAMELFIGPKKHQPFDTDGTIPRTHLHNFEHASISMTLFLYACFAIAFDKIKPKGHLGLTHLLGALAFAVDFFLFHLHSTDQNSLEGQYHLHLQSVIVVCLVTTLMGIGFEKSFLVSFVRSLAILFHGLWLFVIGIMLWTASFMPKGCFMNLEEAHYIVRCNDDEALHRAKSLVNIEFSWYLIGTTALAMCFYLIVYTMYGGAIEYEELLNNGDGESENDVVEGQKKKKMNSIDDEESKSFIHLGKSFMPIEMER